MRRLFFLAATIALSVVLTGCTIGYRYHRIDDTISNAVGANAKVKGSSQMVELGVVLDFRYFRMVAPYLGAKNEMDIAASDGGGDHKSQVIEERGFRLDVPVVSVWNDDDGFSLGYPGTMVHRNSLELWLSGTGRFSQPPMWFGDVGLVYYHHNWAAVRVFGGWGEMPVTGQTSTFDAQGSQFQFWKTTAGGFTAGADLTIGAGEQALDFLKYFFRAQESAEKPIR